MSYVRVIPRDLFNEANLLKCYGQLYLRLESLGIERAYLEHDGDAFEVVQDADGALSLANVTLYIDDEPQILFRPLNSRQPFPLYLRADEDIAVFTDSGEFTDELWAMLT
jgi:hypothetical protein